MDELLKLRDQIDDIDKEIVELFEKRMAVAEDVAEYKRKIGKPVLDKTREDEKVAKVRSLAHTDFNAQGVNALFNQIMTISRMRQYMILTGLNSKYSGFTQVDGILPDGLCGFLRMPFDNNTRVVYHGVDGAYGHQAMLGYFGGNVRFSNVPTFREGMEAIKNGDAEYGILPIENSSTGIITDVYDLLGEYDNYIVGEYVVKVSHALLTLPEADISDIKTVYSHPQGLLQCRKFLGTKKEWRQISLTNTAIAAKKVKDDGDISQAAIASESAATFHGLKVLKSNINDLKNNSTRFIIIKNQREHLAEANQVSICFELPHASGTLYNILSHFIFNGLNMNKIESRPIPGKKWQYRFFIDFDGCLSQREVRNALTGIESETKNFRILGNYIHAE